ncbi:MAG: succinate dehydrogenase/fumarate reductase iron-sulfur subunit [Verrucomicrobiota bacterium]
MTLHLRVWRQPSHDQPGEFVTYDLPGVSPDSSFLEMLDLLNEMLTNRGEDPVAFDHDCREGICGMCSLTVDGIAHGPEDEVTICQTHMRKYSDGDTLTIEPFRATAFPLVKDLAVDRGAFDRIIQAGGFISVRTGGAPDANLIPISKTISDMAMDAAACIGCGACVAACKNGSAALFTSAKASHLNLLPQGEVEKDRRVVAMVEQMDHEGFGSCTNTNSCEAVCPKGISVTNIARMNRQYALATLKGVTAKATQ